MQSIKDEEEDRGGKYVSRGNFWCIDFEIRIRAANDVNRFGDKFFALYFGNTFKLKIILLLLLQSDSFKSLKAFLEGELMTIESFSIQWTKCLEMSSSHCHKTF